MKYKLMLSLLCCSAICGCSSLREVTEDDVMLYDRGKLDFVMIDNATKEPFTGVVVKYYPDGKVQSKESYKNGLSNGPSITWYKNGQISFRGNYIDDKNIEVKIWYPNGNLFIDLVRDPDAGTGNMIEYYASGEKWSESRWDKKERIIKDWLRDGRLVAESTRCLGKWQNGTVFEVEYEIPIIKKYSDGKLVSTTDVDGNPVDITKLKKKSDEELTREGYGMPIGFEAKFK